MEMKDLIVFLVLALFGIIGYRFMGRIDGFIDRHVAGGGRPDLEKVTNEPVKTGESEQARPGMPVFLHVERKSHTRGF